MILLPTTRLSEAERRAERILQHGIECSDRQLLAELWCALRNAESAEQPGHKRDRLGRLCQEVGGAIAEIESELKESVR